MIAGQDIIINTDVVDSDIPVLLSKSTMKKANFQKVKFDLETDTAEILGVKMALNHTQSGHVCCASARNLGHRPNLL